MDSLRALKTLIPIIFVARLMVSATAVALISSQCIAQPQLEINCAADIKKEAAAIKKSPHGVRRIDKHTLKVNWQKGVRYFQTEPPYDDDLFTEYWFYCGYLAQARFHLILKTGDPYSGVLLDDNTGALLPGGEAVIYSPTHKQYLAYEQHNGMDGANIKLHARDGAEIWKGYNGILKNKDTFIVASFSTIRWNEKGQFQAFAKCLDGKDVGWLTLSQRGHGWGDKLRGLFKQSNSKWEWLPEVRCQS